MGTSNCHPHLPKYCKGLCRSCYEKDLRVRNTEFAERQRQNRRDWGDKNPDKARDANKRALAKLNPSHRSLRAKYHRWAKRGMSPEQGEKLLDFQAHTCALCMGEFGARGPDLDHCHLTGLARGFLCPKCNKALGLVGDNVETLQRAIEYLNYPPAERFLNG